MKALALILCFALPVAAQPKASDAPVKVKQGDIVPFSGVLDTEAATVDTEKRLAASVAKVDQYEKTPPMPTLAVVIIVTAAVCIAGGIGGTIAVQKLTAKP